MWSNKSLHLRPFRLCYVFHHRSDCCARDDSVRSVWRASFRFFCSDLATPSRRPNRRCFAPNRISAFAVLNLHWASACGEFLCRKWWSSFICGDNSLRRCCYLSVWNRLLTCRAVAIAMALAATSWCRTVTFRSFVGCGDVVDVAACSAHANSGVMPAAQAYPHRAALGVQTAMGHGRVGCTFPW